jgi:hypothetical protein
MKTNRGMGRIVGSVVLSGLMAGATGAAAQVKWKGTVVKEGDVTVVKNPKEPLYKTPVLELKEDLSIGGPAAEGDYAFGEVRDFVVDDAGAIYVLDRKNSNIKVFDPSGKYLRTIGRQGQGPGELESPRALSINRAADELAVLQTSRRMSFFKLDGTFLRHLAFKEIWALYGRVDSQGQIYVTEGIVDPANPRYELKKLGPDGTLLSTIARSPGPSPAKFNPFRAATWWLLDRNDALIYGNPETYEIQVFSADGRHIVRKILRDYDPVAITDEEKEQEKKDNPPSIKLDFSTYHSAYNRFFLSDLGHIITRTWEKAGGGKFIYDVFDAEGRFIGRIPLKPTGIEILKGRYYALEEDDEGYPVVKRYAVAWNVK